MTSSIRTGFKRHGFLWVMLPIFIVSISIHWVTAWYTFEEEQRQHNQPLNFNAYLNEATRQTFENIQSEALQLILQVALLASFWYVGSTQSKEGNARIEAKINWLMEQLNSIEAEKIKKEFAERFPEK